MSAALPAQELNFDGLVGPTHNYGGLSYGNVASQNNLGSVSSPKQAALQGLDKMRSVRDLGLLQAVLPPQERPDIAALRRLGFSGTDAQVLAKVPPDLLAAVSSASSMWVANAASISPSADCGDKRSHITPANLVNKFHRSIEVATTARILKAIFPPGPLFEHHQPLPAVDAFGDEGAANHTRLCADYGRIGVEIFTYGKDMGALDSGPKRYPARQTLQASQAIARLHELSPSCTVFVQQNPEVIDQGVFHNDVIAVGNRNVLLFHEKAFAKHPRNWLPGHLHGQPMHLIEVPERMVSVADAVSSYLFNSQLLSLPNDQSALIVPAECQNHAPVWSFLQQLLQDQIAIQRLEVLDLTQSMRNGGGPACLRLRVVLNDKELAAINPAVQLTDDLYLQLRSWIEKHYRDELKVEDLADPSLLMESRTALDELSKLLKLGSIYPFQLD